MNESIYSKLNLCPAKAGTLCQCGRCKKIIFTLAAKAGIHPAAFADSLGLKVAKREVHARALRPLGRSRIAESVSVSTRGGKRTVGAEAIVKVLTVLSLREGDD